MDGHRLLTADHILLAVGTRPSIPRGIEPDGQTVSTSDEVLTLPQLPRTMAVVGAGVIGIEYASMFAALGVHVTVIDQRPRPLEFLDQEIGDELIHQLRKHDVLFRCGDAVEHIDIVQTSQRQELIQLASDKYLVADVISICSRLEYSPCFLAGDASQVPPPWLALFLRSLSVPPWLS